MLLRVARVAQVVSPARVQWSSPVLRTRRVLFASPSCRSAPRAYRHGARSTRTRRRGLTLDLDLESPVACARLPLAQDVVLLLVCGLVPSLCIHARRVVIAVGEGRRAWHGASDGERKAELTPSRGAV